MSLVIHDFLFKDINIVKLEVLAILANVPLKRSNVKHLFNNSKHYFILFFFIKYL